MEYKNSSINDIEAGLDFIATKTGTFPILNVIGENAKAALSQGSLNTIAKVDATDIAGFNNQINSSEFE